MLLPDRVRPSELQMSDERMRVDGLPLPIRRGRGIGDVQVLMRAMNQRAVLANVALPSIAIGKSQQPDVSRLDACYP